MLIKNLFPCLIVALLLANPKELQAQITANELVNSLKSNVTCTWRTETVDTFKSGNPDDAISGVACTFTASMDVLKKAVEQNCNLIITHEPTFYNHTDNTADFQNDAVYLEKKSFIDDNKLIIFRFHDHWHMTNPDGIYVGMLNKLGWSDNLIQGSYNICNVPGQTVSSIAEQIVELFPKANIRIIGNPDLQIEHIGFSAGAPGFESHLRLLRRDDVNLLLIGEAREWETVEYVRDAAIMGQKKALIILGHALSEEAGMEYCAEWLSTFITEVPVSFIESGDPFN